MNLGKRSASAALLAAVLLSAATGCSNKAQDSGSSGGGGNAADVKTDVGIEGKTIKLGVLTDLTGVFAALGALFITAMPLVFQRYADVLPFVGSAGGSGLAAGEAARFLYGFAIILVILFEPAGLAGLAGRFRRRGWDPGGGPVTAPSASATSSSTTDVPSDRPAQGSST